jgi:hypothetical protein
VRSEEECWKAAKEEDRKVAGRDTLMVWCASRSCCVVVKVGDGGTGEVR